MLLKKIYFEYLSAKDRRHVIKKLKPGPSPFLNNTAIILGGGKVLESDLKKLKNTGVDLALNRSWQESVEIRNIVFEIPKEPDKKYLEHLENMKASGSKLFYRPSYRDLNNGMYIQYEHIPDYFSFEQRVEVNNINILDQVKNNTDLPTPYYRYSIFLAIWWAVASGCKEIHLYGFELPHNLKENRVVFGSETLNFHKGDNAYTLLYKVWIDLLGDGIEIKMDDKGVLSNLTRKI